MLTVGGDMKEVLRKISLLSNWLMLGGTGILFTGGSLFGAGTQDGFLLGFGVVLLVVAVILHKVINWIFY